MSITRLTGGSNVTRQAITKHLRVMEQAGLVRGTRHGVRAFGSWTSGALKARATTLIGFQSSGTLLPAGYANSSKTDWRGPCVSISSESARW